MFGSPIRRSILRNRIVRSHHSTVLRNGVLRGRERNIPRRVFPIRVTILESKIDESNPVTSSNKVALSSTRAEPSHTMLESSEGRAVPGPRNNNGVVAELINRDLFITSGVPSSTVGRSSSSGSREVLNHGGLGRESISSLASFGVGRHPSSNNHNVVILERVNNNHVFGVRVVGKATVGISRMISNTFLRIHRFEGAGDRVVSVPEDLCIRSRQSRSIDRIFGFANIIKPMIQSVTAGITRFDGIEHFDQFGASHIHSIRKNKGHFRKTIASAVESDNTSTIVTTISKIGTNREMDTVSFRGGPSIKSILDRSCERGRSLDDKNGVVPCRNITSILRPERVLIASIRNDLIASQKDSTSKLTISSIKLVGNGKRQITSMGILSFENERSSGGQTNVGNIVSGSFVGIEIRFLFRTSTRNIAKKKTFGTTPDEIPIHVSIVGNVSFTVGHGNRSGNLGDNRGVDRILSD
mmetsp:Transcript_29405/g.45457  ORF Transcript_29405/g.45457 Transcript_29405/m.45457 type:complete len:469 (+) Transcript_29405:142-1548(+)